MEKTKGDRRLLLIRSASIYTVAVHVPRAVCLDLAGASDLCSG